MSEQKTASDEMESYFKEMDSQINNLYELATKARKQGYDPEQKVDIPLARNMAERVTGLISAVAPQIVNSGVSKRITELEKKYGVLDWRISLIIAEEIAKEKHCKFNDKKEAMEVGIRVGFAYHTLGSVASPLEGFSELKIEKRKDGKEFFKLYFSGPIRSAGGTGASVSVIIADYVRKKMGYDTYDPTETEIKRYVTELYDYHERIANLQYLPSPEEIEFMTKRVPVQIAGDPSEDIEVSNYKDLERVETNMLRNGVCLTIGEGLCQKAPKLWKQLSVWGHEFDLEQWDFLAEFIDLQKKIKSKGETSTKEETKQDFQKIKPDFTYIKDLVAGRPILTHPLAAGGFRLRYGRSRTSGYSATSIHPATMKVLNSYIATGTQLKTERPGKGCTVTVCDTIEGPIIKIQDGSVIRIDSENDLKEHLEKVDEILFLGDMLVSYGDFLNRAHLLVPPGYCEEWWIQELEKATVDMFGNLDTYKLLEFTGVPQKELDELIKNPLTTKIPVEQAIIISKKLNMPLHPRYTYHWKLIDKEQLSSLISILKKAKVQKEGERIQKIIIPFEEKSKRVLELIGVPHIFVNKEFVVIEKNEARAFNAQLDAANLIAVEQKISENKSPFEIINETASVKIRDKSGVFIGSRMGRPEKAKMRKLTGSPHVLFPVGKEGGRLRSFQAAIEAGKIRGDFVVYFCKKCNKETIFGVCEDCDKKTEKMHFCKVCGIIEKNICTKHGKAESFRTQDIDIKHYFEQILKKLNTKTYPDLIKGVRGTSNKEHIPEHLLKGIIRAKHDIYVNKDGTTRFDMTQLPITHFKPKEIGTTIEKLKELGYAKDIHGRHLENNDQTLELKPQDIILPACLESPDEGADKVLFRISKVCDELLTSMYNLPSYYNLKSEQDLAGQLVLVLAPHTSAAIAGRIIGFSQTQGLFAHPLMHAATRRDCDGDEASVMLLLDVLLNFSRQYLPAHRGATQDAPLVMTSKLTPSEVDDMIFDMDIAWRYPLEFYNACLLYKQPWEVDIDKFRKHLSTPKQYEGMGFTHDTANINNGVRCSAYKTLPSMEEKLRGQMDIAEKLRAVDTSDVARLVIEKHFIKDTKGNLRKFSTQEFRCVKCNEKFRRPPLIGKCTACGGRIIFTISEGSVVKYLGPSISLANKYNVPDYLKQSLELLRRRIEDVFGKEKEKQEGLGRWFG